MLKIIKEKKEVCCETLTNEPSGGGSSNKCRKGKFKSQLELPTEKAVGVTTLRTNNFAKTPLKFI